MGNCQTIDAAALVIQHPDGKIERKYWTVPVSEVMKLNPGHYVSLIIPLPAADVSDEEKTTEKTVKFTRVKLLKPGDTLVLGRAYRLVTSQEVMKVLKAKKYAKQKKKIQPESSGEKLEVNPEKQSSRCEAEAGKSELEKTNQAMRHERRRQRIGSTNIGAARSKSWSPSLLSISERKPETQNPTGPPTSDLSLSLSQKGTIATAPSTNQLKSGDLGKTTL
ncbi:hypothetical protein Vadar_032124 [Vaccinium darrowii]|uniref:Uncharacterized protein n=1 Tax=Vaccinium darrowii TaxID=229202 RepID=A0ACB7X5S9_9ERIC|nr:hypothetical protein Vadar_032124 [Vaccinium darrowii]